MKNSPICLKPFEDGHPLGIHVANFVVDGSVKNDPADDAMVADAIAKSYMAALNQSKVAWSWELELRSKNESF